MAVTDSRVKAGTLLLGAAGAGQLVASCQPTAVSLTPTDNAAGDAVEVLCGDQLAAESTTTWALTLTAIQDWENADGIINWAMVNDQTQQPFEWAPMGATGPEYSGTIIVKALVIGGAVATRNTSNATWPLNGVPVRTEPTP